MRKFSSIIGLLVGFVLLMGLGFYIRYRSTSAPDPAPSDSAGLPATQVQFTPEEERLAPIGTAVSSFARFLEAEVVAFHITPEERVYYMDPDGSIWSEIKGGARENLSASPVKDVFFADFSAKGKHLLVGYGAERQWSVFDLEKKSWQPLAAGILSAAWSPVDERIVYLTETGLEIIDVAASKPRAQLLQKISLADVDLSWPASSTIVLAEHPSALVRSSILTFDLKTKNLLVLGEYNGYHGFWNSSFSRGVVFRGNAQGKGGVLFQVDGKGQNEKQFSFLTLPSKCVFFEETVLNANPATTTGKAATTTRREALACSVPRDQTNLFNQSLPDDYLKRSLFTQDDIYRIDPSTGGLKPLIIDDSKVFDADLLQVQNGRIFFRNRLDMKIYSVAQS